MPTVGDAGVSDVNVTDPVSADVPSTSIDGVGSHDIGGVIDGQGITAPAPERSDSATRLTIDVIRADLATPPTSGEWPAKGENRWHEKDKHWICYKFDSGSHRLPKLGASGPSRSGISGQRWLKVRFRNDDVIEFSDDYFVPTTHRSDAEKAHYHRMQHEDWVATIIYVKSGVCVPVVPPAHSVLRPPGTLMTSRARTRLSADKGGHITMSDVLDGTDTSSPVHLRSMPT